MKRFHVHIAVASLADNIDFYSKLFGQAPSKERPDYAKWMLDDPRVNFAISARGHATGINHFGFQADNTEELQALKQLAEAASGGQVLDQGETACCYAGVKNIGRLTRKAWRGSISIRCQKSGNSAWTRPAKPAHVVFRKPQRR